MIINREKESVMNKQKEARNRWLTLRLSDEELQKIESFYKGTTCQSLSEYARDALLRKPLTVIYRNGSADEFLTAFISLKNELSLIGNNYNQSIKKLHATDNAAEIKAWVMLSVSTHSNLLKKAEEIRRLMLKISEQWSPK